jgi:hypothetical protein
MQVNIKEFLEESNITEAFYPGKKLVHSCKQTGEYKNHCVVMDWRDPSKVRIEIKAGMSGKDLTPEKLKYYPVSLQSPTYVDIEIVNDNDEKEEEEEEGKSKGKSGSGSKGIKKKKRLAMDAFSNVVEGKTPDVGKIVEMVVMGTKIAADAYANVMGKLAHGIQHAKISTTDMLAQAGKFVTKYTPPAFMKPTGDEQATYQYDREKNADIGYRPGLG